MSLLLLLKSTAGGGGPVALAAVITCSSTAAGAISRNRGLSSLAAGITTLPSPGLLAIRALGAAIANLATVTPSLRALFALAVLSVANATVTGLVSRKRFFAAISPGLAAVTGGVLRTRGLGAAISGLGNVMADFFLPTTANAKIDAELAEIEAAQTTFFNANGRYWQGRMQPSIAPADGATGSCNMSDHPTDQAQTWTDVNIVLPSLNDVALAVDVYDGPMGKGYVVRGEVMIAGARWVRCINYGPDTWRTLGWTKIGV